MELLERYRGCLLLKHAVEALGDEELRRLAGGRVVEGEVVEKDERRDEADVPALPQG